MNDSIVVDGKFINSMNCIQRENEIINHAQPSNGLCFHTSHYGFGCLATISNMQIDLFLIDIFKRPNIRCVIAAHSGDGFHLEILLVHIVCQMSRTPILIYAIHDR